MRRAPPFSATAMSVARPLMLVGPSGCHGIAAIRRRLLHRAVRVVGAAQILGVRLRRLLRPEIGRDKRDRARQNRQKGESAGGDDALRDHPVSVSPLTETLGELRRNPVDESNVRHDCLWRHHVVQAIEALSNALFDSAEREQHGDDAEFVDRVAREAHFFLRLPRERVAAETLMRGHASRSRSRVSS